jgi:hypothetical protein
MESFLAMITPVSGAAPPPQPPLGIWGPPSGFPTNPIVLPPGTGGPPLGFWGGVAPPWVSHPIAPGGPPPVPTHPIYIPVYPSQGPGFPTQPIVLPLPPNYPEPPPGGEEKPPPPDGGWGYHPQYGWGYFPAGGKPQPMPPPAS